MSASDEGLRCNNLSCRTEVARQGRAVVTNCSHVFCVPCANEIFAHSHVCPACSQELLEGNDIVETFLNPTSDYRGSILSGLSPHVVLEIASRAIDFWTYQTSQELRFQSMVNKNSEERLARKDQQLVQALGEMAHAKKKIANMESELDTAGRKNQEMAEQLKQTERELAKLPSNHDKLKAKSIMSTAKQATTASHTQMGPPTFTRPASRMPVATPSMNQAPLPFVPGNSVIKAEPDRPSSKYLPLAPIQPNFEFGSARPVVFGTGSGKAPHDTKSVGSATSRDGKAAKQQKGNSRLSNRRAVGPADYGDGF